MYNKIAMALKRCWIFSFIFLLTVLFCLPASLFSESSGVQVEIIRDKKTEISKTKLGKPPKIAVTNLAYERQVREYFRVTKATQSYSKSSKERETDYSYKASDKERYKGTYTSVEGTYSYILIGELKKFTADIKGEFIKSNSFQVIDIPLPNVKNEQLFDIIKRIKKGEFKKAEYVLFGSVTDVQFRDEFNEIVNTNTWSKGLSLELMVEFKLVNTKTSEVAASFSAVGSGSSIKLISNPNERVIPSRVEVMKQVSKSLAQDTLEQLLGQWGK